MEFNKLIKLIESRGEPVSERPSLIKLERFKDDPNIYIHFSNSPMLKFLNPLRQRLGIYAYPLKEVWNIVTTSTNFDYKKDRYVEKYITQHIVSKWDVLTHRTQRKNNENGIITITYPRTTFNSDVIPYQKNAKYIFILRLKNREHTLDLIDYSEHDLEIDINRLKSIAKRIIGKNFTEHEHLYNFNNKISAVKSNKLKPGESIIAIVKEFAYSMARYKPEMFGGSNRLTINWRKSMMLLGYYTIIDRGLGVFHHHEKYQAVFFDSDEIEIISLIHNKSNDSEHVYPHTKWKPSKDE